MGTSQSKEWITRRSKHFFTHPRARTVRGNQPGPACSIWIPAHQIGVPVPPRIRHKFRVLVSEELRPVRIILSTEVFQGADVSVDAAFVGRELSSPSQSRVMLREPQVRTTRKDCFRGDLASLWLSSVPHPGEGIIWTYEFDLAISHELPLVQITLSVETGVLTISASAAFLVGSASSDWS